MNAESTQPLHLYAIFYYVRAQLAAKSGVLSVLFPDLTRVAVVELQVEGHIDFHRWCTQFRSKAGKRQRARIRTGSRWMKKFHSIDIFRSGIGGAHQLRCNTLRDTRDTRHATYVEYTYHVKTPMAETREQVVTKTSTFDINTIVKVWNSENDLGHVPIAAYWGNRRRPHLWLLRLGQPRRPQKWRWRDRRSSHSGWLSPAA